MSATPSLLIVRLLPHPLGFRSTHRACHTSLRLRQAMQATQESSQLEYLRPQTPPLSMFPRIATYFGLRILSTTALTSYMILLTFLISILRSLMEPWRYKIRSRPTLTSVDLSSAVLGSTCCRKTMQDLSSRVGMIWPGTSLCSHTTRETRSRTASRQLIRPMWEPTR